MRIGIRYIVPALLLACSAMQLGAQVQINEVMASNASDHPDPDFGEYCDWIELYNPTGQDVDLSSFFLSDDPENPTMWQFQSGTSILAGEYLLVYADGSAYGLHTNFELANEGETVYLLESGTLNDSLAYPQLPVDISFGRRADLIGETGYFENPTAGLPNGDQVLQGISATPHFSLAAGFYSGPQSLTLFSSSPDAKLYYSLNGREPDQYSQQFLSPLSIDSTMVVRVRSYEPGHLPGEAITRTFFIDEPQNLPIISVVTNPEHFFSDKTGIYVIGTNGVSGFCTDVPHNVNQDWERPVNLELFETNGQQVINQRAGAKIFGGCSRTRYPIKNLAFFARKAYGANEFACKLFPNKSSENYESFILRAGADDQPYSLFRDGMTQNMVREMGIDVDMQAYRPTVLYINGQYWGIHNMREKINEHYPEDNHGVNSDSVDLLTRNPLLEYNTLAGSADHYNNMVKYMEENDITLDQHYEHIKTQMDVNEYLNYQIIQIFFKAQDWPGNNIKFWRSREAPDNRWRWVLYDLDQYFKDPLQDIMDLATNPDCGCGWPNPPWSTYLFRRLLENESFRHEFTQRFALYAGSYFTRERLHEYINEFQAVLAPEIPRHIERWGGQVTSLPDNTWVKPIFSSVEEWEGNVQVMRDFLTLRHELAMSHIHNYFNTSGYASLQVMVDQIGTGSVAMAGLDLSNTGGQVEFLAGEPVSLKAQPETGYLFSHWERYIPEQKDTALITERDLWNYLESRDLPASDWTSVDYDDQQWSSGLAELGYGDGDESTEIGYGGNASDKYITSWFRKKFSIADSSLYRRYTVRLIRDDGARVFLNGKEVIRDNMQRWYFNSPYAPANSTIGDADESTWLEYGINPGLFRSGENVIAVEIHQISGTSSDISFDLELTAHTTGPGTTDQLYEQELNFDLYLDQELTAVMVPDEAEVKDIFINEIMASNDQGLTDEFGEYEDWLELFNGGTESVDLAGLYLSDSLPAISAWMIPEDLSGTTLLEPGEFMVVIADNESWQGPLHASFKLNKDGDDLYLLQRLGEDTLLIDHLSFGAQATNSSFGHYPDGNYELELLTRATPGSPNYLDLSSVEPIQDKEIKVYPVPAHERVFIQLNESLLKNQTEVEVALYSIQGRMLAHSTHNSSLVQLDLDHLDPGMYLLKIEAGAQHFVRRIILR